MAKRIQVLLHTHKLQQKGKQNQYSYDELVLKETSGKRLYFTAIKNGMRMVEVIKTMQLVDGKVYVSFGKVKHEIGTYEEVAA